MAKYDVTLAEQGVHGFEGVPVVYLGDSIGEVTHYDPESNQTTIEIDHDVVEEEISESCELYTSTQIIKPEDN